jgi:hypothetical protein
MFEGGPMKGFPRNQQNQYIWPKRIQMLVLPEF